MSLCQFACDINVKRAVTSGVVINRLDVASLNSVDVTRTFQLLGVNVTSSVRTDYVISGDNIIQKATTHELFTAIVNMDNRLSASVHARYYVCIRIFLHFVAIN